ncbi:hypothetical protein [Bacillus alkalicellulosilyticus]|uniref:hypothetical protein n=1 Tax=Alkalihalobacterium alkalicellulosilyticum TaxID=1912214 RepID=UPI0009980A55|nr:hypothetical protein [Bacillus alkalicellulosilyticus]
MRKRFITLASCLVTISLVACGNTDDEVEVQQPENQEKEVVGVVEETEPAEELEEEGPIEEEEEGIDHHQELPYEWAGSFNLEEGTYTLVFNQNEFGDESILLGFILENSNIQDVEHHAAHMMEHSDEEVSQEGTFAAKHEYTFNLLINTEGSTTFTFTISEAGSYRMFTEHHAEEFKMQILSQSNEEIKPDNVKEYEGHGHEHEHDHE